MKFNIYKHIKLLIINIYIIQKKIKLIILNSLKNIKKIKNLIQRIEEINLVI